MSPQNTNPQTKTQQNENKSETKQKTVAVFLCASAEEREEMAGQTDQKTAQEKGRAWIEFVKN